MDELIARTEQAIDDLHAANREIMKLKMENKRLAAKLGARAVATKRKPRNGTPTLDYLMEIGGRAEDGDPEANGEKK